MITHRFTGPTWPLILFSLVMLLSAQPLVAENIATTTRYHDQAQQKALWLNQEWLKLVHYKKAGDNAYLSQVDDNKFFSSVNGKTSPRDELLATLSALFKPQVETSDHAQCRFIARYHWLTEQLDIKAKDLPEVECAKYTKWRSRIPDHQVTMIFPAYHLNSPSSMFGHTLLRLDPEPEDMGSDWLSIAVNFGANVRADDNSLFFALKGLTGGYPGFFIVKPYFEKIKEYNRNEKRDIWEYKLNLTPEETQTLILHLWELRNTAFDYYFFDENCSYRLLELLEVARPGIDLTSDFNLTAIPVDTIRAIERENMILEINYRPSQVTVLEELLMTLDDHQQQLALSLSSDISVLKLDEFNALSNSEKKRIVEIAYKYLRYQETDNQRIPDAAKQSFLLLKALNRYPASDNEKIVTQILTPPEQGHLSNRIGLSMGRAAKQNYAEVSARLSFHSLEDNNEGFLHGAQINLGSIQFRAIENEGLQLQQLDLVDIFSLTPRTRFFKPLSWRVYTGMERQWTYGQERLVSHVSGGGGVTFQPWDDQFSYAMLTLRLESNRGFDDTFTFAPGLILGALQHFESSTLKLELSAERFTNDEYRVRGLMRYNIPLSTNHALMFSAQREYQPDFRFNDVSLSYHYFF